MIFTGTFEVSFANSAIHFSLQGFEWQSAGVKSDAQKSCMGQEKAFFLDGILL